jgi:hypothetical protein
LRLNPGKLIDILYFISSGHETASANKTWPIPLVDLFSTDSFGNVENRRRHSHRKNPAFTAKAAKAGIYKWKEETLIM